MGSVYTYVHKERDLLLKDFDKTEVNESKICTTIKTTAEATRGKLKSKKERAIISLIFIITHKHTLAASS